MNTIKTVAILAAVARGRVLGRSGTAGVTTRYWDCCKASCSWNKGYAVTSPVTTCDIHDQPLAGGASATNGCPELGDGTAFMCSSQQPWAVNSTMAYGFAAVTSSNEADTCCACYQLTFTDQLVGKSMIVQATNIGGDVSQTQFDLAMPGGGVGAFPKGCTKEWNAPANGWGGQAYGGVSSRSDCASLPSKLQPGCDFRFDWFQGANNPGVQYQRVSCPNELVAKSNCRRNDDGAAPPPASFSTPNPAPTPTPSQSQPAGPTATHYGQCGGANYNGPTQCPPGYSCQKQNQYYSQCL